ncbi:restriction endonuclease subunit S [Flavobacterium psychrophilum]|nr:restriction endonuclease subunit S [Flavobacterium psychrophilum]
MGKLSKYKSYKSTEESWIQNIPEHWEIYRLKHVFGITKRIVGELGHDVLSITQRGIKVKDTESGAGQLSMDYSKYQQVDKGDFAMNHMDLLTGFVDVSKYDGVISPDYRVFKLIHLGSDAKFLLYILQLSYKQRMFFKHGKGVSMLGRWRLPSENFKDFLIPFPPKEEQTKIKAFLDYKIAKIDRFIKKKQQLLELSIERRKSLTTQIINSNSIRFLRLSSIVNLIHRPIEFSESNSYTPVGLYNRGRGIFHKPITLGKDLGDSSFFYIKEGDVILSGQFAWEGSVALAKKSDEGCIASHRYPILECKKGFVIPEYIFSFFTISNGHFLLDINSKGSAGRNRPLNPRTLLKEKIPVPSIFLQESLIEIVKSEVSLKNVINKEIALAEEYKSALIKEAVTGKIDVRYFEIPEYSKEENYDELEEELDMMEEEEEID